MDSGDLSNDLLVGILTPSPAARPSDSHPGREDELSRSRPRHRAEEPATEAETAMSEDDAPIHEIDRMA